MLVLGKSDSFTTALLTIDFGFQIFDQRSLATVDPNGEKGQDKLEVEILYISGLALEKCIENR